MFTGIVEGFGTITGIRPTGSGRRLSFAADFVLNQTKIGDSISVSGACLTVVSISGMRFDADVSAESIQKTTLGRAKIGKRINIERALRLSDRLDGHLVTGHVDGIGTIADRNSDGSTIRLTINIPEGLSRYIIAKGSVAVDGVSLTVNNCFKNRFDLSIIPHTAQETTLGRRKPGDAVNIETDMIGKYVERFISPATVVEENSRAKASHIDLNFLEKTGFF
jgi:riboflavin synthase